MKITKKILAIQAWPAKWKSDVLAEIIKIEKLPLSQTCVKISARASQLIEAGLQFKKDGIGENEARLILGINK